MAGLWDRRIVLGETAEAFTIITTSPNGSVSPEHDSMLVILTPKEAEGWLEDGGAARLRVVEDDYSDRTSEGKPTPRNYQSELKN